MSKVKEATNDFCTRCFKYKRCTKSQSECTMADSYEEGYGDGYYQAEKDLKLTWKDIALIETISKEFIKNNTTPMTDKDYYQEVLKQFNKMKEK